MVGLILQGGHLSSLSFKPCGHPVAANLPISIRNELQGSYDEALISMASGSSIPTDNEPGAASDAQDRMTM